MTNGDGPHYEDWMEMVRVKVGTTLFCTIRFLIV